MIRLYSNQEKPDVVPMVDGINTNETEWWMIYDANALQDYYTATTMFWWNF
jgi:hypothetical protein